MSPCECGPGRSARRTDRRLRGFRGGATNPSRLSVKQLCALLGGVTRELAWGLPAVAREVRGWRALAEQIPVESIRDDALSALTRKRGQTDGAALLAILPRARSPALLRLLVAYQLIWDFLDSVHEQAPNEVNGRQLHLALVDALEPRREHADYYLHHRWRDDGGYLRALVDACRASCLALPGYERVRALVVREAWRAQVLALNHATSPAGREAALKAWSEAEFPGREDASWFEMGGACSAGLTIFALLALAAEPGCEDREIERTRRAYFWTSVAATMLDSYVDEPDDVASGDHVYIAHYASHSEAIERVAWLLHRCMSEAAALRRGEQHIVIAASMTALYLSKDSARSLAMRDSSRTLAVAGGSLTRVLVPVLRLWRTAYAVRST